jgi:hypothetical protein
MMRGMTQVAVLPRPSPAPVGTRWVFIIAAAVVVLLLVAGLLIWVAAGTRADQRHSIAADIDGRKTAVLDVASGADTVTVHTRNLGDDLYRVETATDTTTIPEMRGDGDDLRLLLSEGGSGVVDVQLTDQVVWQLRFTGGANRIDADLSGGRISTVDFIAGTSTIELTLPYPSGEVPIRMSGGVGQFTVHAPSNAPAWVRAGGGAGSVTIDGTTRSGVSGGAAFASSEWNATADRYAIDCTAGMSTFVLDRAV